MQIKLVITRIAKGNYRVISPESPYNLFHKLFHKFRQWRIMQRLL